MSEYYLVHSGRSKRDGAKIGSGRYPLGSGERPYQSTGGLPRSKASRKRPNLSNLSEDEMQKAIKRETLEQTYAKTFDLIDNNDPSQTVRQYSNAAKEAINGLKAIEKKTRPKRDQLDLSSKSDEELRREINRTLLERQYNDLFNSEQKQISAGRTKVLNILDTAGDVIAVATPIGILAAEIWKATH